MSTYEERTARKKHAIIQSALNLFGKTGFSQVSIKDIAADAQVSQVSIYNYFGSKEALVHECTLIIMRDTIALAEQILVSKQPFIEKLEEALQLCNQQINLSLHQFLSLDAAQDSKFLSILTKEINQLKKEIYLKYIACGKLEHAIDPTLSTETISWLIDALNALGTAIPQKDLAVKQAEIIQLFLYGIVGKPAK